MLRIAAVLAALATAACGPVDVFNVVGLDDAQFDVVQAAADEWCEATDGARCPVLARNGASSIRGVDAIDIDFPGNDAIFGACTLKTYGRSDIQLLRTLTPDVLRLVALHEFGHHFGCFEIPGGTIMDPYIEDVTAKGLTATDVACAKGR